MIEQVISTIRKSLKAAGIVRLVHPFRGFVSWACQKGFLPSTISRVLPWSWVTEPFVIYGNTWTCPWYPTDYDTVGHRLFWSGLREWEKETAPVILSELSKARCFMDIGANCGIYSVLGCILNPKLNVIAIEPVPKIFNTLSTNTGKHNLADRLRPINVALGSVNGVVPFHESEDPTMGSLAIEGYMGKAGTVMEVECRTLDSLVDELGIQPDFLKIDVEGFEHAVLLGATKVLISIRPRIVLEANPGDRVAEVSDLLTRAGYVFYLLTDNGPSLRPEIIATDKYRNWLCVPQQLQTR